jgi:hypothetical protein
MSHDDFAFEPIRGVPAPLPQGESLLWQGVPRWSSLAVRGYHVRKVAIYFAILALARVGFGISSGHTWPAMALSCAFILVLGGVAIGVLSLLAYLNAVSTVYSITDRRVLLQHGIAVPITMNIPFELIASAGIESHSDGTGEIALRLIPAHRVGYVITWPHVRPGHITRPQPSFRGLADGQRAADVLGTALAAAARPDSAVRVGTEPAPAGRSGIGRRAAAA